MGIQTTDIELWQAYFANGKPIHIRNKLVEANMKLVYQRCRHLQQMQKAFDVLEYDEMVNIAVFGLISAIEKFQLKEGNYFLKFAIPFIEGRLKNWLRDKSRLIRFPVDKHDLIMRYLKLKDNFIKEHQRNPTLKEVFALSRERDRNMGYSRWKFIIELWAETQIFESGRKKSSGHGSKSEDDDSLSNDDIFEVIEDKSSYPNYIGDSLPLLPRSLYKTDHRLSCIVREVNRDKKTAKLFQMKGIH